jgi:GNAT superfamily N-acetyltransferase
MIPQDRWKEPYMTASELKQEIERGVEFYGWREDDALVAVMVIQHANDVTLIRHAYVLTAYQRRGIGEKLLRHLMSLTRTSTVLVGTWEVAHWAVHFYDKHGFTLVQAKKRIGCSENTGTFLNGK